MENGFNDNDPEQYQEKSGTYQGVGGFILEIIKIIVLAFVIIVPIRMFLFQPFFVQGASMEPNFADGEYLIINELGFKETNVGFNSLQIFKVGAFRDLKRQRAIVFRYPIDPGKYFIKRIIGLPNETVQIEDGQVKIFNEEKPEGFVLDEKEYLSSEQETVGDLTLKLGEDEYFVLGDNRMFSSDSRAWGPVPQRDIIGEVALRAWPLNRIDVY